MIRERAIEILMESNGPEQRHFVEMYVTSFLTYLEAEDNIRRVGAVVAHPRTGAPLENPYLKVRSQAMREMRELTGLKGLAELWEEGTRDLGVEPE